MRANHLVSKFAWASAPSCHPPLQALFPASVWHRDRRKPTPVHPAACLGSLEAPLALGGDSFVRFEPPASATMILKTSAFLCTSTFRRRSDDRSKKSPHF